MFEIKSIKFKYSKKNILNNISLYFYKNKITSILLTNGADIKIFIKIIIKILKFNFYEVAIKNMWYLGFKRFIN